MNFDLRDFVNHGFVETGTFHGGGVSKALAAGFRRIVSIEVFEPLVAESRARFAREIAAGVVDIVHGDSGDMLGSALQGLDFPVTFWLDAHIQTMSGAGVGREKCPVVAELRQIAETRRNPQDIILIDDLRLIEDRRAGWAVDLGEFYRRLWQINPRFSLCRIDGHVPHDVLACVPRGRQ